MSYFTLLSPAYFVWFISYEKKNVLLSQQSKPGSHVLASSLVASNTKCTNLT